MSSGNGSTIIDGAISMVETMSSHSTDGKWLERLTVDMATHIRDWDIQECDHWSRWTDRERHFPQTTNQDVGIDAVAVRRSDGRHIAIQCKSRQLDESGNGSSIHKSEIDKFANASSNSFWAERWVVTNGAVGLSHNARQALSMSDTPIKVINIRKDLQDESDAAQVADVCPHCQPNADRESVSQTKDCMQNEAVTQSVRILEEHVRSESGGLPIGQSRGKIVLPCGTGKTRISLRIVEKLSQSGDLAVVLCPSIALVAQIRREYLQHAAVSIRALAVCSDQTAGYNPKKEDVIDTLKNPTADNSNVSASEVKGMVTTDSDEIAEWIREGEASDGISVIFGTYQSGRRVADALKSSGVRAKVLIADEAHRTAGLRRKKSKSQKARDEEQLIRDFTLCHDNDQFPVTYRVYQTATPKVFGVRSNASTEWIVRTMDDETVFGVELYRKSYPEAVRNGWLSDYRIIALGVNDPEAYRQANLLASETELRGRKAITSLQYLRGLAFALAMGGATQEAGNENVIIKSCIAFLNSVAKSKEMANKLQTKPVRDWVQQWLRDNADDGRRVKRYTLEHLDASSNVTARDNAKQKLADAGDEAPYSIMNVGIFGEGADAPSLNAVAFLEARKSPIDVIQAVGRAMRTAPDKERGYIICPILIPPEADPEQWLSTSDMDEGWTELGQILMALRAHDQRIEDNLSDLLYLCLPKEPEKVRTVVAVANKSSKRIQYREHQGPKGSAQEAMERVLGGESLISREFSVLRDEPKPTQYHTLQPETTLLGNTDHESPASQDFSVLGDQPTEYQMPEPTQIVTGKSDGADSIEMRIGTVARKKTASDGTPGAVDIQKTKAKARKMINDGDGIRLKPSGAKTRTTREKPNDPERSAKDVGMQMILLSGLDEHRNAIKMNLLSKSGLSNNRITRDLNLLENGISEAAYQLRSDGLMEALNRHFGLNNLKQGVKSKQADGCTIAALLMMNAAMLHQRISAGRWIAGISDLSAIKNDVGVVRKMWREWERIMRYDFHPIFDPAVDAITAIEETGKTSGLERALHHLASEAERIAETYADMGADHAGPLFNRVMGNQASDGAFFTRPVAAEIAARLTLDACGELDWTDPEVWRNHKTVDLACGSGTLLTAMLTEMKKRAAAQGADPEAVADLQKLAVEDVIKGLDINPVSLQLAAAQLTAGNRDIRYRGMGIHLMPYGPHKYDPNRVSAGSLELIGQKAIIPRHGELEIDDEVIDSQATWESSSDDAELEDAVEAVKNSRIVIMNPPFTNRANMGQKFPKETQKALRARADAMEKMLVNADPEMSRFADKNSIGPLFVALADRCLDHENGILTMIKPTIALTTPSGINERRVLAQRYHIHTVLTCHQPRQVNMSQHSGINESIIVATRRETTYTSPPPPPPRKISVPLHPARQNAAQRIRSRRIKPLHCRVPTGRNGERLGRDIRVGCRTDASRRLDSRDLAITGTSAIRPSFFESPPPTEDRRHSRGFCSPDWS